MLRDKILQKQPGIITYGMTPPKAEHPPDKIAEIAQKQCDRIRDLAIDALILYDVQEEADRVDQERPFPYAEMLDPKQFSDDYLSELSIPKIIYRCVGRYDEAQFIDWVKSDADRERYSVYVGASSSQQQVKLNITRAAELSKQLNDKVIFGGVVIPERHMKKHDEHLRVVQKVDNGCNFFVSQATYNIEASKDFLSDYYYHCTNNGVEMVPILFNLAPCGSGKTLEFMKWLGISIPRWLENDLKYSSDVLDKSICESLRIFEELLAFGLDKGIPVGCSVESVSTRKVEIEASVQLVKDIKGIIDQRVGSANAVLLS